MTLHVIVGAGPVGSLTASLLVRSGESVRMISRKGSDDEKSDVERVQADASDPDVLRRLADGAAVLYDAASPPYSRWVSDWPPLAASVLSAAEASGAVLVTVSNLYGYGPPAHPMVETDALNATSAKGRVRASIWQDALAAHEQGRVRATELRSSDYFGPRVRLSQMGERVIPRVLVGKSARVIGDPDAAHSWTYITDVARALIALGADERAWGRAWHTPTNPAMSQRQFIAALCAAANLPEVGVRTIPSAVTRALGLLVPTIREIAEIRYQLDQPFVVDSSAAQNAFGLLPTPMPEALRDTVSWYREPRTTRDHVHGHPHHAPS
jgi:nucleoside-diphosphate-sugar epimerase